MFKYICLIALLLAIANANEDDVHAQVLNSYSENDANGHFKYGVDVSNGIDIKAEGDVNGVSGEYFLLNDAGEKIRVTYTADSTGFHPVVHNN